MIVKNKRIRRLVAEESSKVTDEQFFCSRLLAGHFERIAAAQTKRYGFKEHIHVQIVWEPENPERAMTNNHHIWINAGHSTLSQMDNRQEQYMMAYGLFAHEMGHVLYTDFSHMQPFYSYMIMGVWYPRTPENQNTVDKANADSVLEYMEVSEDNKIRVIAQIKNLWNIIEDAYIEDRIMRRYPGIMGLSLKNLRNHRFSNLQAVSDMANAERHIWESIECNIHSYALYGSIKYGSIPLSDQRIQNVFEILDIIDEAVYGSLTSARLDAANRILIRLWPVIKDYFDFCDENSIEPQTNQSSSLGEGSNEVVDDDDRELPASPSAASRETTANEAGVENDEDENAYSKAIDKDEDGEDADEDVASGNDDREVPAENAELDISAAGDSGADADGSSDERVDDAPDTLDYSGSMSVKQEPEVTPDEGGRIPPAETSNIESHGDSLTTYDDDYSGTGYEHAAGDIQRILESIGEQRVEENRSVELNNEVSLIDFGDVHKGVDFTIHRMSDVDIALEAQYDEVAPPLLKISKLLQKSMLPVLKDRQRGYKQTSLIFGRKLNQPHLYRNDGKVFCRNNLPEKELQLAIGCIFDESGSMSYGDRITYARASAIVLLDFCRALNIPIMVYGHSAFGGVDLYSYAEFDAIDNKDKYRLMDMSARCNNRDGAAIRYVAEKLSKRPERTKLLIVTSDGQPSDAGYYGSIAEDELRSIQREYGRKGVDLIAAAIGADKDVIERIYGNAFLDISNLEKLPMILTSRVRRLIAA